MELTQSNVLNVDRKLGWRIVWHHFNQYTPNAFDNRATVEF